MHLSANCIIVKKNYILTLTYDLWLIIFGIFFSGGTSDGELCILYMTLCAHHLPLCILSQICRHVHLLRCIPHRMHAQLQILQWVWNHMHAHVSLQVSQRAAGESAVLTLVWFLSGVNA